MDKGEETRILATVHMREERREERAF